MKENKNIERLFQEKFKDFEVSPPDFVWDNIQEKLNPKEKKRRVIPFWFKATGIAASFVALFSVVYYNSNESNNNQFTPNNSVVNSGINKENQNSNSTIGNQHNNASESNSNENSATSKFKNRTDTHSRINSIVNHTHTNSGSTSNAKFNPNGVQNSSTTKLKSGLVSNQKNNTHQNSTAFKSNTGFDSNYKKQTHSNSNTFQGNHGLVSNHKKRTTKNSNIQNKAFSSAASGIAFNRNSKGKFKNKNAKSNSKFENFSSKSNPDLNFGVANLNSNSDFKTTQKNNSNSDLKTFEKSNATHLTSKNTDEVVAANQTQNSTLNSNAIAAIEDGKLDSITLATVIIEENIMEKLLREKETKKVVDEKEKWSKWAVNSYVSPVFFNSFTNGSPISDEFSNNQKNYKTSTSYGVGIAYNLNKRLVIKTGVSNLNLDYDTEDIAFYSTFEDQSRIANTNIERNSNGKYLVLKHEKDGSKNTVENQLIQSGQNLGSLNQRTQYIEVPLEMSYAILNKKFGVAIKGGMSTLFLTENSISITSEDGNMQIGKASNLNDLHFSSNIGLGLSYIFMKNLQINVEPTLKYQINTFTNNSADFKPYYIGVNTGISYKF